MNLIIRAMRVVLYAVLVLMPPLFAEGLIRDCQTTFYDIDGENGTELFNGMKNNGKVKGGFFAYTTYSYKSNCKTLTLKCVVLLPRWGGRDTSENKVLNAKWDKFYPQLVAHEQGHVDIFNEAMQPLSEAVKSMTCAQATAAFKTAYAKVSPAQKGYDAETKHGVNTGASFGAANYQGIAYSQKANAVGYAFNQETQAAAKSHALSQCKAKDCKFLKWANGENMCVSLAVNSKKAFGSGFGKGADESDQSALQSCGKYGTDCKIRTTVCAGEGKVSE